MSTSIIDILIGGVRGSNRFLLVQRTGWGKSEVYFRGAHRLREKGQITIVISPLLALIRNQLEAAHRFGLRAESINSTNRDDHPRITSALHKGDADILFITPERLRESRFWKNILEPLRQRIGMLVVDEAHCISDWGHDFRPNYRRIRHVIDMLPPNTPVLATTATANDRIVRDISEQLGSVTIIRGPLTRREIALQTFRMSDPAFRLAWLAYYIPKLPGTGIVYVLTRKDADLVAAWLESRGIAARAYYSGVRSLNFTNTHQYRAYLERLLQNNEVKVLVATKALGMGFHKPDLGFVIHYQAPDSLATYYQQVGRAGRNIRKAYGILLAGEEDERIHEYFRRTNSLSGEQIERILNLLEAHNGLSRNQLHMLVNLHEQKIKNILEFLETERPAPVYGNGSDDGSIWRRRPVPYSPDRRRAMELEKQRLAEWQEVQEFIDSQDCLMAQLCRGLGDATAQRCGQCASCRGEPLLDNRVPKSLYSEALRFLLQSEMPFEPRKKLPRFAFSRENIPPELQAEEGRILARWNEAGWGKMVAEDKKKGHFRDVLVEAMARMIRERWKPDPAPAWVTCVPSFRQPHLVPDFARRLAKRLGLPFVQVIEKIRENEPQGQQQNSFHKCRNLYGVFRVRGRLFDTPVLLVDDIIDSGWTMTYLAALLRRVGCGPVYPVALASRQWETDSTSDTA